MRDAAVSFASRLRHRIFHLLFLLRRPMTLGVRTLVHDRERDAVLLVRHTYVPGWQLPGGGVEPGETALEAALRELQEEAHVVADDEPALFGLYYNRNASRRDHVAVYLVTQFRLEGERLPDREIAEAAFFPIRSLPCDTTPATRRRIAEALGQARVSLYW